MDISSFLGIISRTILDYSRDPYMSTVKGPVIRLLLTIAHTGIPKKVPLILGNLRLTFQELSGAASSRYQGRLYLRLV